MWRQLIIFASIRSLSACPPDHPCYACGRCFVDRRQKIESGCQKPCGHDHDSRRRRSPPSPTRRRSPPPPTPRRRRTSPPPPPPCLCLFDVDRTLTGDQNDTFKGHHCKSDKVIKSIHDSAFGGGPLTLSQLALHLDKTFCVKCYTGVITHGIVDGDGSKMRSVIVTALNKGKESHLEVGNTWVKRNSDFVVASPLVYDVGNGHKHHVASAIRDWYKNNKNVQILAKETHFFDDEAKHVEEFKTFDYNAVQVSCGSRDNSKSDTIGYCGAATSECNHAILGVHICSKSSDGVPTSSENATVIV